MKLFTALILLLCTLHVRADKLYFECVQKCDKDAPMLIYKACVENCALLHGPQVFALAGGGGRGENPNENLESFA